MRGIRTSQLRPSFGTALVVTAACLVSLLPLVARGEDAADAVSPAHRAPAMPAALERKISTHMPVLFVASQGQDSGGTLYTVRSPGLLVLLRKTGITLMQEISKPVSSSQQDAIASRAGAPSMMAHTGNVTFTQQTVEFVGANPDATVEPLERQAAKVNYFFGKDSSRWITGVAAYSRVRYHNLYPGIDLIFYSRGGQLEYDFVVAAGADPDPIRLKIAGNDAFNVTDQGELQVGNGKGAILHRPLLYQNIGNRKRMVAGQFVKINGDTVGFHFAAYDRDKTFIIDPAINLLYSTFVGGVDDDEAYGMTLDAAGNAYIVGLSPSQNFPVTGNAYSPVDPEAGIYFAVVLKFDPSGNLLYSTGLGGEGSGAFGQANYGYAISVDSAGDAWVGGATSTTDFPVTQGAVQSASTGTQDAFLSELSPDGSSLMYSTYFGGTGANFINSLVMNADGSLWMAGGTSAGGFPVTANGVQAKPNGTDNYFVAKVVPGSGGTVQIPYLTYVGGSNASEEVPISAGGGALAVDGSGNVYLAGMTFSGDYPVTSNAYEKPFPLAGGCGDGPTPNSVATLTKFSSNLSQMLYSTVIGGKTESSSGGTEPDCNQAAVSIHLDGQGNIWLTGTTGETDFPITSNAISSQLDTNGSAGVDFFLFELSSDGSTELYGTYLGGSGYDYGDRAAWDANNNIWIVGNSNSTNFPVTSNALQSTNASTGAGGTNISNGYNVTLTELNPTGTQILYSTYFGGSGNDCADGNCQIAIDQGNNIHLAGGTASANFPVTQDAFQPLIADGGQRYNNTGDMFYSVLGTGIIGTVGPTTGGNTGDVTLTISGAGFESGATCDLVLNGTSITATSTIVNSAGTTITCIFALNGAAPGNYNVIVTNTNGTSFADNGAFTVESGGSPNVWTNIVGRGTIRSGVPSTFVLEYGNSGNTDAIFTQIWIVLPTTITVSYTPAAIGAVDGYPQFDYSSVPQYYDMNGQRYVLLAAPRIAPGKTYSLALELEGNTLGSFQVEAYNDVPFYTSEAALKLDLSSVGAMAVRRFSQLVQRVDSGGFPLTLLSISSAASSGGSSAASCLSDIWQAAWGVIPGSGAFNCTASVLGFLLSVISQNMDSVNGGEAVSVGNFVYGAVKGPLLTCAGNLAQQLTGLQYLGAALNAYHALGDCAPYYAGPLAAALSKIAGALDPNEKSGNAGDASALQYVNGTHSLPYNIGFENEATATLPAAEVVVTDQLDPTRVNLSSVTLGPISWGASNVISPPSGVSSYATTYTPSGVTDYVVRAQGSLDADNGLLKWTLQTIDPTTGQPPTDPTVGFLPPDADGVEGQGSVVFNVMPEAGQSTGAKISNSATVVFDANAPINTNSWTNTLDVTPPTSAVTALPATTTQTSFTVSWSGTDVGSGIASYNIYASTNGGGFTLWQSAVSTTSATFTGTVGNTYSFLSQATDEVGNLEPLRTSADTATEIVTSLPPDFSLATTSSSASVSPGGSATFTLNVTPVNGFTAAVSFSCSGLPSEASCSFSPTSVTPSGTAAITTTMTITTMASTAQLQRMLSHSQIVWAVGFFLLPALLRKRRAIWFLILLCLLGFTVGIEGCGGGGNSSSGPSNPGTPAGTSMVIVTATSGSGASAITHTTMVTLTVQ